MDDDQQPLEDGTADGDGLPRWNVLLSRDDANQAADVVKAMTRLTPLTAAEAKQRMAEATSAGSAVVLETHRERAELYQLQFAKRNVTVSIEPASAPNREKGDR